MDRQRLILAALAAFDGAASTPVQVQKLLFLLDRTIAKHVGGPHFHFVPHDYGPFDKEVYDELENLARQGFVTIERHPSRQRKSYRLTSLGQQEGLKILDDMTPEVATFIRQLSEWIRRQSFDQLVSTIYREYPDMKVNSVFRG